MPVACRRISDAASRASNGRLTHSVVRYANIDGFAKFSACSK
jgi:hypothetical protein